MKNIVTIDFDIIMEPSIQLYNNSLHTLSQEDLAATSKNYENLIGNYHTYSIIFNYILKASRTLPFNKIHFIEQHESCLHYIPQDEEIYLTNIDHHHDVYYQTSNLDSSNWVRSISNLKHYFWINNYNSEALSIENLNYTTADITQFNLLQNLSVPDELVICSSFHWIPLHIRPLFFLIMDTLNRVYDIHFDFEDKICYNYNS